jgi:hypothetical protein
MKLSYVYDDGGRAEAGYKGETGDCGVRAAALASGRPYEEVYQLLLKLAAKERPGARRKRHGKPRSRSHPRTGIWTDTMHKLMYELGFLWVATMQVGSGCKVHLADDELPGGRLVVRVSKHYTAVLDGVIHDTYDPRRTVHEVGRKDGVDYRRTYDRCVYGYWQPR